MQALKCPFHMYLHAVLLSGKDRVTVSRVAMKRVEEMATRRWQ